MIKNTNQHSKTKHIKIRYHFLKDHYEKEDIEIDYVSIDFQIADIFTKHLILIDFLLFVVNWMFALRIHEIFNCFSQN